MTTRVSRAVVLGWSLLIAPAGCVSPTGSARTKVVSPEMTAGHFASHQTGAMIAADSSYSPVEKSVLILAVVVVVVCIWFVLGLTSDPSYAPRR